MSKLSRKHWIDAALDALAEGGAGAVAVEPLAARLGVTKGSFYWHFGGRDDLLEAALATWESEQTDAFIARLDAIEDPRRRLAEWGSRVFGKEKALLAALHAAADHPVVAPVLRRVTERRIDYLVGILREAGIPPATARRRGRLLYSADIGAFEVGQAAPVDERERRALTREIVSAFLP